MLSRVAENLYWMSRYVERAENVARLLDVGFDLELDAAGLARDVAGPRADRERPDDPRLPRRLRAGPRLEPERPRRRPPLPDVRPPEPPLDPRA